MQLQKVTSENRRKKLMTEVRDIEKKLQKSYRAVDAIKTNSKYFFSYAKKFSKVVSGIGPLMDIAKTLVTSPTQMAEMLSTQYSSVFSEPKEEMEDPEDVFPDGNYSEYWIHNVAFDQEDIVNGINEIYHTAAAGPDRFPAILLKHCRNALALPLYLIWRKSLDWYNSSITEDCKYCTHPQGEEYRGDPANYRPVALTSHLIKLFENILKKHIVAYMEENNIFNPGQHGVRLGRSCLSQLIAHYDHITRLLESGQNVDVISIDFDKAFDKVDYLVTMQKLKGMGISGKLGRWLHAFLTNRKQAVVVNGTKSIPADVKSGVPQGSVLGPLLFLVLIGDIDREVTTSFVSSFADDTRAVNGISTNADVCDLQVDLDAIYNWADENNMEFNNTKFECLRYGCNNDLKACTSYKAKSGERITEVDHVKVLGVTLSSNGKTLKNVLSTANQLCGWVLRTYNTRKTLPMMTLWKTLIRSRLDYCCQLWCPSKKGDVQALEQLQRQYIRKISGILATVEMSFSQFP